MTDNKDIKIAVKNISVFYSGKKALNKISMNIERNKNVVPTHIDNIGPTVTNIE